MNFKMLREGGEDQGFDFLSFFFNLLLASVGLNIDKDAVNKMLNM